MDPSQQVQGLPPGAIVGPPLAASAPATPAGSPSVAPQGLPPGAVVGPPLQQQAAPQPTSDQGFSLGNVAKGAGQEALGMAQGAATQVFPGQNDLVDSIHELPAVYKAYEMARQQGKGMWDAVAAADAEASKQEDARNVIKQRVAEFTTNPDIATGKLLMDAVAVLAGAKGFKGATAAAEGGAAEAAGATGATEGAGVAPEVGAAEKGGPAASGTQAGPIDTQVAKAVEKAGISKGTPETQPPTGENIQPDLERGVHAVAKHVADSEGVEYKPESYRDSIDSVARGVLGKAKADFRALDEASGGHWQRFDDALKNIQRQMNDTLGVDEDRYSELEQKKAEIETQQSQMIEDMKQGIGFEGQKITPIDPSVADRAIAAYRKGMALHDTGAALRMPTNPKVINGKVMQVTAPDSLASRLTRLNDVPQAGGTPRLQQALGPEGAKELISRAGNAQVATQAIKEFKPQTSTGQFALDKMIRENTSAKSNIAGRVRGDTNWNAVRDNFEKMNPDQQKGTFGHEVDQVREYLNKQAQKQHAISLLKKGVGIAAGTALGTVGYEAAKGMMQ